MLRIFLCIDVLVGLICYAVGWWMDDFYVTCYIFLGFGALALVVFAPAWPWWKRNEDWITIENKAEKPKKKDKKSNKK